MPRQAKTVPLLQSSGLKRGSPAIVSVRGKPVPLNLFPRSIYVATPISNSNELCRSFIILCFQLLLAGFRTDWRQHRRPEGKGPRSNQADQIHRGIAAAGKDCCCRAKQRGDAVLPRVRAGGAGNEYQRGATAQGAAVTGAQRISASERIEHSRAAARCIDCR